MVENTSKTYTSYLDDSATGVGLTYSNNLLNTRSEDTFSYDGTTNGVTLRRTVGAVVIGPNAVAPLSTGTTTSKLSDNSEEKGPTNVISKNK